jgi:hypothetical protein
MLMSFERPYLRERDAVTNLEFDVKGETDEEELLQAENEHHSTVEKEEQTPASPKKSSKIRFFEGHALGINLKRHPQF